MAHFNQPSDVPYDVMLVANHTEQTTNFGVTLNWNESEMSTGTMMQRPIADPSMYLVRLICEVGISLPIAVLGIIGNVLAFVVLCYQKQRLTTNVLLQALAVTDTLILISSILLRSMRYVGWEAFDNVHHFMFLSIYPCVYFFRLADTWLTVMMTIDRYIAVCHPLKAQRVCTLRRTYITIAVIAILTLLFSLPRFLEYRLEDKVAVRTGFVNTDLTKNPTYTLVYRIVLFFLLMYLIPMALLIILNIRLMCTLRKAYANRSSLISNGSMHNGKSAKSYGRKVSRGVTIIVATVVIVCVICNVSAMMSHVIWSLQICFERFFYLEFYRRFLANISNIMVTFNCAINFVIYCMFSRKFRAGLSETFTCNGVRNLSRRWRSDHHSDSSGAVNTSYTSVGLLPIRARVSFKNPKLLVQHKTSADQ